MVVSESSACGGRTQSNAAVPWQSTPRIAPGCWILPGIALLTVLESCTTVTPRQSPDSLRQQCGRHALGFEDSRIRMLVLSVKPSARRTFRAGWRLTGGGGGRCSGRTTANSQQPTPLNLDVQDAARREEEPAPRSKEPAGYRMYVGCTSPHRRTMLKYEGMLPTPVERSGCFRCSLCFTSRSTVKRPLTLFL